MAAVDDSDIDWSPLLLYQYYIAKNKSFTTKLEKKPEHQRSNKGGPNSCQIWFKSHWPHCDGLPELSWEDQQQIQEQLLQQKEQEKDYPINNSKIPFSMKTKKRQTSLTEFTGQKPSSKSQCYVGSLKMRKSATMILRILQIAETSSYLVENSLNKFYYLGIILLISVFMTVSTHTAATSTTMIITPTPTPTPSITTPNTQLNLETLFRTLLTQELSSADTVVHTTELERILDDIAGGQYQISAEFEDQNGEEDTEKTLTITIAPIGPTATPTEEEEAEPEDDSSGDNGDDNGNDDSPEESEQPGEIPGSPPF